MDRAYADDWLETCTVRPNGKFIAGIYSKTTAVSTCRQGRVYFLRKLLLYF
jgi:hypothetical protein